MTSHNAILPTSVQIVVGSFSVTATPAGVRAETDGYFVDLGPRGYVATNGGRLVVLQREVEMLKMEGSRLKAEKMGMAERIGGLDRELKAVRGQLGAGNGTSFAVGIGVGMGKQNEGQAKETQLKELGARLAKMKEQSSVEAERNEKSRKVLEAQVADLKRLKQEARGDD